jgi:hypothetical protein
MSDTIRTLTEKEARQIELWAHQTRLAEMVSFFETMPRHFVVPRPVLLGSNNSWEILVNGFTSKRRVISAVADLDEPFNPHLQLQKTLMAEKREESLGLLQPIYRELSKGLDKVCLASSLGDCSGKIVRAHSLQRASFQAHAKNGHVYEIDPFKVEPDGHWPTLVGINKATTFTGFCEHHDGRLFKSIETSNFAALPQQFFMHHYRALALAFYSREYKGKVLETAYAENSQIPNVGSLKQLEERVRINKRDADELRQHRDFYDRHLKTGNWAAVEGYAWIGNKVPDFFAADYFGARKNLQGTIVQDTKSLRPLRWISLTVTTAADNRALVLLCAEKGSPLLTTCVASLRRLPRDRRTMAVVNYILHHTENFIMLPKWWDGLQERTKKLIVNTYDSAYFPRELPHVCEWGLSEVKA